MALLTPMTISQAQVLGRRFGLEVRSLEPIPQGSVNSNFSLGLVDGGKAFLRLYEESDHEAVRQQNGLLAKLVEGGVMTPSPLALASGAGTVAEHAAKPVSIFPFCDGQMACQKMVDAARAAQLGTALARIHQVGQGASDVPRDRFGLAALQTRLDALQSASLPDDLGVVVSGLAERLRGLAQTEVESASTVVHGDLFRDNVLWHHDGRLSALLDFESASMGRPAFDLMVTVLAWCFGEHLDQGLARAMVAGYQAARALSPEEIASCHHEATLAAVRFAITRITDYELRPAGVVVYKDYRRFMGRLDALDQIGSEGFPGWLGLRI